MAERLTREAFIEEYCTRRGVSWAVLSERRVCLPCDCGEEVCQGWAMVPKDVAERRDDAAE